MVTLFSHSVSHLKKNAKKKDSTSGEGLREAYVIEVKSIL